MQADLNNVAEIKFSIPGNFDIINSTLNLKFNSILDVGFGTGGASIFFALENKQVVSIGINTDSYNYPKDFFKTLNIDIVETTFEKYQTDKKYDALWVSHILEHVLNVGEFLKKCRRLLTDDGWLFVMVPPYKSQVVGGHVSSGWNMGQLLYNLLLTGYDIKNGYFIHHKYNICAFVQKSNEKIPPLIMDIGDIEKTKHLWPIEVQQGFDGNIKEINWFKNFVECDNDKSTIESFEKKISDKMKFDKQKFQLQIINAMCNNETDSTILADKIKNLEVKLEARDAKTEGLNAQLEARDAKTEGLNAQLEARDAKTEGLNAQLEARDAKISVLNAQLEARDAKTEGLNAQLETRDAKISVLNAQLETRDSKISVLNAQLETRDAKISGLNAQLETRDSKISGLNAKLKARDAKIEEKNIEARMAKEKFYADNDNNKLLRKKLDIKEQEINILSNYGENNVKNILTKIRAEVLEEKRKLKKTLIKSKNKKTLFQKYEASYIRKHFLIRLREIPVLGSSLLWIKKHLLKW